MRGLRLLLWGLGMAAAGIALLVWGRWAGDPNTPYALYRWLGAIVLFSGSLLTVLFYFRLRRE